MTPEMQVAMVGVIGTLAGTIIGTVLGWLLNHLSLKGKLSVFITSWEPEFVHSGRIKVKDQSVENNDVVNYAYKLSLDLYNSSGTTKIMRDIRVLFCNGKNKVFFDTPQNAQPHQDVMRMSHYNDVEPTNIPPKSVGKLNLRGSLSKSEGTLKHIWSTNTIMLQYTNEHNKKKLLLIKKVNYANYFEKLISEEDKDGQTENAQSE